MTEDVTVTSISVTVPQNTGTAAETYRILFTCGDARFPFNIIVSKPE